MADAPAARLRSLYRSILRELPPRPPLLSATSSIRSSIRSHFSPPADSAQSQPGHAAAVARRQEAEQFVSYLKAQRMYGTLLERYNPGMGMDDEERIRLTARRVGMDMPESWYGSGSKK